MVSLGSLSGAGNITIAGSSDSLAVDLSNTNGFLGSVTINRGTVLMDYKNALTTSNVVTVNGGMLNIRGVTTQIRSLAGTGGTVTNTSGTNTLLTVSSSSMSYAAAMITGSISLNVGKLGLLNTGNTYTGFTAISGSNAVLAIWGLADGGLPSSLGISSNVADNLTIAGTLEYDGDQAATTDRLFTGLTVTLTPNFAPVTFSNSGSITSTGPLTLGGAALYQRRFAEDFDVDTDGQRKLACHANQQCVYRGDNHYRVAAGRISGGWRRGQLAWQIDQCGHEPGDHQWRAALRGHWGFDESVVFGNNPTIEASGASGSLTFSNTGTVTIGAMTLGGTGLGSFYPALAGSGNTLRKTGTGVGGWSAAVRLPAARPFTAGRWCWIFRCEAGKRPS